MKKVIIFFFIFLGTTNLHAQNRAVDSLKQLLPKEKTDTGKIKLLISMGSRFGFGTAKNDSALWYLQQALDISNKINYHKGEIYARQGMSNYLFYTGNYPEALKLSLENLKKDRQYGQYDALFYQTRLTGWIYGAMGDYRKELEYSKQLMAMADSEHFKEQKAGYFAIANTNISGAYIDLDIPDSALFFLRQNYEFLQQKNNNQWYSLEGNALGEVFSKMKKDDSAFYYYRIANYYAEKIGRNDEAAASNLGIARLFFKNGKNDSAFLYTGRALNNLQHTDAPANVISAYSLLSKLYKENGQYDSAFKYMESYVAMKDSVFNQNKIVQAQNFSFNETLQQQQLEQTKKEAQQKYQTRLKVYSLAGILFVFLTIAFLLYRNNRTKQKANALLNEQKEEVQNALSELKSTQSQLIQSEKMASLGELTAGIAHEIQNPLNFVNNFSEVSNELMDEMKEDLEKGDIDEAKSIVGDVKQNLEKIVHHGKRADAIVKGMLQHSRSSTGVKEPTDVNALCDEYLRLAYHGMRAKDKSFNADFKTNFDEAIGKINIIPQDIGRVLLNLFNNAFYACAERSRSTSAERSRSTVAEKKKLSTKDLPGFKNLEGLSTYEPTVSVSTKKSDNRVIITVSDNGNGIPQKVVDKIFQPFFTTKPTGEGTGLGLSLAYDMVKAHGGELKVNSNEGQGTEFIISLPNKMN